MSDQTHVLIVAPKLNFNDGFFTTQAFEACVILLEIRDTSWHQK